MLIFIFFTAYLNNEPCFSFLSRLFTVNFLIVFVVAFSFYFSNSFNYIYYYLLLVLTVFVYNSPNTKDTIFRSTPGSPV